MTNKSDPLIALVAPTFRLPQRSSRAEGSDRYLLHRRFLCSAVHCAGVEEPRLISYEIFSSGIKTIVSSLTITILTHKWLVKLMKNINILNIMKSHKFNNQ